MMPVTVTVALLAYTTLFRSLVVAVGLGLKAAVTPLGSVEGDRVTLPEKPFCGETVIVLEPLLPWVTVRLPGEAERRSEEHTSELQSPMDVVCSLLLEQEKVR